MPKRARKVRPEYLEQTFFNADGTIRPVVMTNTGVTTPRPIEEHP